MIRESIPNVNTLFYLSQDEKNQVLTSNVWIRQVGQVNLEANRQLNRKLHSFRRFSGTDLGYVSIKADLRNLPQKYCKIFVGMRSSQQLSGIHLNQFCNNLFIPVKSTFQIILLNNNHEFSKGYLAVDINPKKLWVKTCHRQIILPLVTKKGLIKWPSA